MQASQSGELVEGRWPRPEPVVVPEALRLEQPAGAALDEGAGLKSKVLGGIGWTTAGQVAGQLMRIAVTVMLAHLLTPAQFGPAGLALTISSLSLVLADPSLAAALVRMPRITEEDRSTVFWTNLAFGVFFTGLGIGLSGLVGDFYGRPIVGRLFAVESLTFLLIGLSATQAAVLTREMSFRSLQLREIGGTVLGGGVGVGLAFAGYGPWAIIGQSVAGAGFATLLIWVLSPWRPQLVFSRRSLRETGSFGSKLFGVKMLAWTNRNTDNLLVGKFLGTGAPLGLYAAAYNFCYTPITRITQPAQAVVLPAFARMQGDRRRLADGWLRGNRLLAAVMMPLFLGTIVIAPDVVPVVLGHRWHQAAPVVQFLCWAGLMESLQSMTGSMLTAAGKAGIVLRYSIVLTALYVSAFAVGLRWGIVGVAACYAISRTLALPFVAGYALRVVDISPLRLVRNLSGVVQAGAFMLAVTFAARELLVREGVAASARLGIVIAIGAASYAAVSWWRAPEVVSELRGLRRAEAVA
jgi:O-antigen/teichoic acid export membrane protein